MPKVMLAALLIGCENMETVNKNLQKIKAMSVVTWYNRAENSGYSSSPLTSPLLMAL